MLIDNIARAVKQHQSNTGENVSLDLAFNGTMFYWTGTEFQIIEEEEIEALYEMYQGVQI